MEGVAISRQQKKKARARVFVELQAGRLKKKPCFCGSLKVEAHHSNYERPLDVEWLCKKHHEGKHTVIKAPKTHIFLNSEGKNPAAVALGRLGGLSRSEKKLSAVRVNVLKAQKALKIKRGTITP